MINRGATLVNRPTAAGTTMARGAAPCQALGRTRNDMGSKISTKQHISRGEAKPCQSSHFPARMHPDRKFPGSETRPTNRRWRRQLRRERITPGAIREKGKEFVMPTFGSGKVGTKEIAIFFRQFSVMIDAGLPLVQCLEILAANQENPAFQKALTGVRTTVEGGATLANAMRGFPDGVRRPHH